MSSREGVMRGRRPVRAFKSPVLVAAFERTAFGDVGQLPPYPLNLAQGPFTKVVVSRFQHHFRTILGIANVFRKAN